MIALLTNPAKHKILLPVFLFVFLLIPTLSIGQNVITKEDYSRAAGFLWQNVNNKKAFNLFVSINWFPDTTGFWYVDHNLKRKTFMKVELDKPMIKNLFDHARLARILEETIGEEINPDSLPFSTIEYLHKDTLRFSVKGKSFDLDLNTYQIQAFKENGDTKEIQESRSPDGKWIAFPRDYNLFIRSIETGEEYQLSFDGKLNYEYASSYEWYDLMEGENGDRPQHFSVSWSPDSKYIQAYICDLEFAEKMYLLDWSIDSLYRPKLLSYYRGSPGDTTMVHMTPVFFDVEQKKIIPLDLPRNTHINMVSFKWSKTPGTVYALNPVRGYQRVEFYRIKLSTGKIDTLITETSATNIDNFDFWLAEEQDAILFASERSGWRQLYLYDLKKENIRPVTKGTYYVNNIKFIDKKAGFIYFTASGREAARNPYYQHLYRIDLNGKDLTLLTPEDAHHQINFSRDGKWFCDNYSTAQKATRTVLSKAETGEVMLGITWADYSGLTELGWTPPEVFVTAARDGKTQIYGAIWKPTNFDPEIVYPVIDHSYTGPHTQMFPKDFRRVISLENQAIAELGFIVLMIDGLGSSGRSKAFHDHSYKNLGGSLADHVLAIRYLSQKYPWVDSNRVGIFGHSAGGYDAAHALLEFPDFYKVAVASSADHDHRMEKAWWPEMYMGWPVDSAYHNQSNITMASNLKGKLLLVHGGLDDNVNPSATFKLAEALVNADKQFDLMIFPGQRHGYRGAAQSYFRKLRWNYFVEHLLGAEPIWDFEWE